MSVKQDLIDGEYWAAQQRKKMGSAKYEEWVKSREITKYTNFKSYKDVKKYLQQAGYNYVVVETENYIYNKTHIGDDVIYWIKEQEKITAVVSTSVNITIFEKFVNDVERVVGFPCFFDKVADTKLPEYSFPTIYTDSSILEKVLKNVGIIAKKINKSFKFNICNCQAQFKFVNNSVYEFEIIGYADLKEIHYYFNKIETEYEKIKQQKICDRIKDNVLNSSMQLENEEILEDDSIVLTISI